MNYYDCLNCIDIQNIENIKDDEVLIDCKKHGKKAIKINDFINNCIGIYKCHFCNNIPMCLIDNKFFLCENCLNEYPSELKESKKLLKDFYCDKHNNLLIDYCLDCNESKCEKCKKDNKNHKYLNDYLNDKLKDEKKNLYDMIMDSEKKIKLSFEKLKKKLISDKFISFNKNSIIPILNIIKNIKNKEKMFFEKMKELKTEFENLLNLDIKMFQKPENKLKQEFSINLPDIIKKNKYIIDKIEAISHHIEKEINLDERNNFLIPIKFIAREADNYSKELCEILKKRFYEENKEFSSICYNKDKTKLSSWVNQSLIKDESNDDIKDLRRFYKYYCEKENKKIPKYLNLDSRIVFILKRHNFDFQKLFRILSQLYTEVLLFSDKKIDLKYAEKCDFDFNIMKDITDLNGERFVIFSVLPGLFVNELNIPNGKILVFCDKNNFTIAKVVINYNVKDNKYRIKINKIKNLKFNENIHNQSKSKCVLDKEETEYNLEEDIVKNKKINVDIEIF